jgi:hypothetical protein
VTPRSGDANLDVVVNPVPNENGKVVVECTPTVATAHTVSVTVYGHRIVNGQVCQDNKHFTNLPIVTVLPNWKYVVRTWYSDLQFMSIVNRRLLFLGPELVPFFRSRGIPIPPGPVEQQLSCAFPLTLTVRDEATIASILRIMRMIE